MHMGHVCLPVQCTPAGWAFPWCLRVRVYEVLLRAVFDSLDEAEYVPDKDRYLQLLEVGWGMWSTHSCVFV
jgi:hypothetical protein